MLQLEPTVVCGVSQAQRRARGGPHAELDGFIGLGQFVLLMVGNFGGFQEDPVFASQAGPGRSLECALNSISTGPEAKKITRLRVIFAAVGAQNIATIPFAPVYFHHDIFQYGGLSSPGKTPSGRHGQ